jgi:hypothetical protein
MKRVLLSLGIAGALFSTGAAAAELQGIVKALNKQVYQFTMMDGKVFSYPRLLNVSKVQPGVVVKVTYTPTDPDSLFAKTFGIAGSATKVEVVTAPGAAS